MIQTFAFLFRLKSRFRFTFRFTFKFTPLFGPQNSPLIPFARSSCALLAFSDRPISCEYNFLRSSPVRTSNGATRKNAYNEKQRERERETEKSLVCIAHASLPFCSLLLVFVLLCALLAYSTRCLPYCVHFSGSSSLECACFRAAC